MVPLYHWNKYETRQRKAVWQGANLQDVRTPGLESWKKISLRLDWICFCMQMQLGFPFICLESFKKCQSPLTWVHKTWQWVHYCSCQGRLLFPTFHLAAVVLDGVCLPAGGRGLQPGGFVWALRATGLGLVWALLEEVRLVESSRWEGKCRSRGGCGAPLGNSSGAKGVTQMLQGTLVLKLGISSAK